MRTIKLTRAMELDALRKVYESQPRVLFLTRGQRERIARVTEERLAKTWERRANTVPCSPAAP